METIKKTHPAVCSCCGKTFDTAIEGVINKETKQHMCAACYRKAYETRGVAATIGNILLVFFGGFMLLGGILNLADGDMESGLFGVAVGILLFLWRILPSVIKKANAKKWNRVEIVEEVRLISWKCPHCGANTEGETCEYCDSPYVKE